MMTPSAERPIRVPHSAPTVGDEEVAVVGQVLRSGQLAQGRQVEAFEEECAALVGRRHAVAVSSGTAALQLAMAAMDIGSHSVVAVPAYACSALVMAARQQGATASLHDVDDRFNLACPAEPFDTHAVIAAHLFGARASLPDHEALVEDIAQSIGGPTGKDGLVSITSFYATKLLTTGEGGMALTDDENLAEAMRDRRDYDNRDSLGLRFNYKLTDFQAALGRVQIGRLPGFLKRRREIAETYTQGLKDLPVSLPDHEDHVFARYVVVTKQRDALERHVRRHGIDAKRPVYQAAHLYDEADVSFGVVKDPKGYPGADRAHRQALSLPIYPTLIDADVQSVIDSVKSFFD